MRAAVILLVTFFGSLVACQAADLEPAARSINALGVDLYRTQADGDANVLLSPYSIQVALAMTFAGAEGDTRAEMKRVLHFEDEDDALHGSFRALGDALKTAAADSAKRVKIGKERGGPGSPLEFSIANRLFAQKGYALQNAFVKLVEDRYRAPIEFLDFAVSDKARSHINRWVEDQTKRKIRDLIPPGVVDANTRLVLANALYLSAPWTDPFRKSATKPAPFHVKGRTATNVPTMRHRSSCGYADHGQFKVITRRYNGGALQFVIILPVDSNGVRAVEAKISPELFSGFRSLRAREVDLYLPKFRMEPETLRLAEALQRLGMKSAFDRPAGSANFGRMSPRRGNEYLYISEVVHKTFLSLDEEGTEAAAATAVVMAVRGAAIPRPEPLVVRVDRPFLFAIQHVESGACLFLGRVMDPR